jgi:hypothetical protein
LRIRARFTSRLWCVERQDLVFRNRAAIHVVSRNSIVSNIANRLSGQVLNSSPNTESTPCLRARCSL